MLVCGVDENGLGPRLGPLVATAVVLELPTYDRVRLRRIGERAGIGDSKETAGFGNMQAAEGVALAVVEALHGRVPRDADELYELLTVEGAARLRARCPERASHQCWSQSIALPAFGGEVEAGRATLARLSRNGIALLRVRSDLACVSALHEGMARLGSRTSIDLSLFEGLLLDARAAVSGELEAVLGMVGGIRDYQTYFDRLKDRNVELVSRETLAIRYKCAGLGTLSFEIDADARHMPVALASMIGKYVRELAMERQNRFYASHDSGLPRPSGYHDPVTRRFVEQSRKLRKRLEIVDTCFER